MADVLLVDDEPGVLYTLREVLTERGHSVVTAASGAIALPLLDDASVVVTDLQMPGMSGLELIAASVARDSSRPVILLTAHGSEKIAVASGLTEMSASGSLTCFRPSSRTTSATT